MRQAGGSDPRVTTGLRPAVPAASKSFSGGRRVGRLPGM